MITNIEIPKATISAFCEQHHIAKLSLFGSVLREDFTPESDIDVLVEFEAGHIPGLLAFSQMQIDLSNLLGRDVHLSTPSFISDDFRDKVLETAQVQYERAG
jgi:uncharacterized protein